MLRWCPVLVLLMAAGALQAPAQHKGNYDEWAESRTINIEGCGVYPAVRVTVDGRETETRGFIRKGRTYLPAREAMEGLGGKVTWVQSERAFYGQYPSRDRTVRVALGSRVVNIYTYDPNARYGAGRQVSIMRLNTTPIICGSRIFAPVRAAVEAAGGTIDYNHADRSVSVRSPRQ